MVSIIYEYHVYRRSTTWGTQGHFFLCASRDILKLPKNIAKNLGRTASYHHPHILPRNKALKKDRDFVIVCSWIWNACPRCG